LTSTSSEFYEKGGEKKFELKLADKEGCQWKRRPGGHPARPGGGGLSRKTFVLTKVTEKTSPRSGGGEKGYDPQVDEIQSERSVTWSL